MISWALRTWLKQFFCDHYPWRIVKHYDMGVSECKNCGKTWE